MSDPPPSIEPDDGNYLNPQFLRLVEEVWCRLPGRGGEPNAASDSSTTASYQPSSDRTAVVIGRFEIRRELGRGGAGIVLLAFDPTLRRDVALKVPLPEALLSSAARRRFLSEARAAAALRHPTNYARTPSHN
jgi:serine/threonine protein kinase